MSNNKVTYRIQEATMFVLALFPIICYYPSPLPMFSLGEVLLTLLLGVSIIMRYVSGSISFPYNYKIFWCYVAVTNVLTTRPLKLTMFIPGGVSFCLFSVILGLSTRYLDINRLKFYMRFVVLISIIIFAAQEYEYYRTGVRFCAVVPFDSTSYGDISYSELSFIHSYSKRSASIFMEPSYFTQYLLVFLCIEIFNEEKHNSFSLISIIVIITIVLSRSGSGIIGLIVLVVYKMTSNLNETKRNKIPYVLGSLLLVFACVLFYIDLGIGDQMMERSDEINRTESSGYVRIVQGFLIYDSIPFFNKLIGMPLKEAALIGQQNGVFSGSGYIANGFQSALIINGLVGVFLLFILYLRSYKGSSVLGKSSILLLVSISMFESIYLTPIMTILTALAFKEKNGIV